MIPSLPKGFSHPMAIGEGSFSSVYRARQKILDRWVAVKILNEKSGDRRQQMLNEARNQAQMSISCIPAVYDAFSRGQQVFIVMEWIKGASLQTLLEKGIPARSDRAALAASVIAALAGLHRLGFAHRDLKPANILVSRDAGVYLVDFGFSKKVGEGGQSIIGTVKGTPAYMAPELWRGRGDVDFAKADLYALGKVLSELSPGPEWDPFLEKLLSNDPAARPDSASDLWEECRSLAVSPPSPEWKASITRASSELVSRQLMQAARQLLFAKRADEAYWLLAECLQEDPDSSEALRLLEGIPRISRAAKRKRWMMAAAAAVAFSAAMQTAFHFGKQAERETWYPAIGIDESSRLLLLPAAPKRGIAAPEALNFREFSGKGGRLAGFLFLEGAEACDSLVLDARKLPLPLPPDGLRLESGEHSLACLDGKGTFLYREKLALLPFQRKIIRLTHAASRKEA